LRLHRKEGMKFLFGILILIAITGCKPQEDQLNDDETPIILIPPKKGIQLPNIESFIVKFENENSVVISSVNHKSTLTLGMTPQGTLQDYNLVLSLPPSVAEIVSEMEFVGPGEGEKIVYSCTNEACAIDLTESLLQIDCEDGSSIRAPANGTYSVYVHKKDKVIQHFKFVSDFQCPGNVQAMKAATPRSVASVSVPNSYDATCSFWFSLISGLLLGFSAAVLYFKTWARR
jgi:hypothetical protein